MKLIFETWSHFIGFRSWADNKSRKDTVMRNPPNRNKTTKSAFLQHPTASITHRWRILSRLDHITLRIKFNLMHFQSPAFILKPGSEKSELIWSESCSVYSNEEFFLNMIFQLFYSKDPKIRVSCLILSLMWSVTFISS